MFLQVLLIFTLCIAFVKWKLTYWKRKNVPSYDTWSIWGNLGNPVSRKEYIGIIHANIYKKFRKARKQHVGIYSMLAPNYMPIDLDILMRILRSDFDHFEDRGNYYNEKDDPVSVNLMTLGSDKWRTMRAKISPAFTKAKIKNMFNIIMECAKPMNLAIQNEKVVDIAMLSSRFTIDVIGRCIYGIECNSFRDDNSDFLKLRQFKIFGGSFSRKLLFAIAINYPNLGRALGIKVFPKRYSKFLKDFTEATLSYRRSNAIKRNDVFQALMDLGNELTVNDLAAQCYAFFLAGSKTASVTIALCLYELSRNPEIQKKTRKEVLLVMSKYNGEITFDAVEEMKYLDQVVNETLRKHPPVGVFRRVCTKDYKVPNLDLVIEKGTKIVVPVLGIHHDEQYYPDPEKFDPDRFSEQNVENIQKFSYLPFGDGPRMCLGRLFGMIEVKIALCELLKNNVFAVNPKVKYPLRWDPLSISLYSQDPIWLDIQKISS